MKGPSPFCKHAIMPSATNANPDRAAQPTRRARRWRAPALFLALYVLLVAFTWTQFTCRRIVPRVPFLTGFDDLGYFVYAHSLFFDGDLDFRNEYKFIVDLLGPDLAGPSFAEWLAAAGGGRPPNHFSIGTRLAAVPWLALFHAVARLAVALGLASSMPPSCGPWYMFAYLCANLFYGLAGLWLTARVVARHFDPAIARAAVFSCTAAGPALYYFLYQPGILHAKTMTVDGSLAFFGSSNFDIRSFALNFELNMVLYGFGEAQSLLAIQESYLASSRKLDIKEWASLPLWERSFQGMAKLLSALL